jgi:RHS repeat-associated protein
VNSNDASGTIPTGLPVSPTNGLMQYRNTFFWDRFIYPTYGTGAGKDYSKAKRYHWLHDYSVTKISPTLESMLYPLENRVWHQYPSMPFSNVETASSNLDAVIDEARVLDNGHTQSTQATYNAIGKVTQVTDPLGRVTQYTYASNNIDLTTVKQLTASGPTYTTIASYGSYNSLHEPGTYTDAAGQVWSYTYNGAGQLLTVTDPLSNVTTYAYDSTGRLSTITDANSTTWKTFTYSSTCGGGSYINCDLPSSITDSEGRTVSYAWDGFDRLTTTTYPDGTTDVNDYTFQSGTYSGDPSLELRKQTDRLSRVTTRAYDADQRLTSITEPTSGSSTRTTTYNYYANGVLEDLIDANSNDTHWAIDIQSRPTSKTYAYGTGSAKTETYAYETTTSRLKSVTDALSQVKTFAYDDANERTGITYTASVHTTPNVTWSWDTYFPRQTSMTDGTGTTNYSYTAIGSNGALKLSSNAGPYSNDTTGLSYDADGRLSARTISGANESWTYDALSRVSVHTTNTGGSLTVPFTYSWLGETNQPTNRYTTHGLSTVSTSWSYDTNTNDRRLIGVGNSGVSRSYTIGYGTAADGGLPNNPYDIQSIADSPAGGHPWSAQTHSYTYDLRDRVLTANQTTPGNFTFAYDNLDNATTFNVPGTSTSPTYNVNNQVSTWGGLTYSYDADGNLLSGDGVHTYKWDAENRLIEIDYVGNANTSTFTYNGIGERISNTDTIGGTPTTTRFLWCGSTICQVRDGSDNPLHRNVDEGVFYVSGPSFLTYLTDQLGDIRDSIDAVTGNFTQAFDYTPYGAVSAQSGWHYGYYDYWYAGMFSHQASGIYFSGTRPYDPNTGRWLRRDPIKENGGVNLYGYTGGDPVNATDPSGLASATDNGPGVVVSVGQCFGFFCFGANITNPGTSSSNLYPTVGIGFPPGPYSNAVAASNAHDYATGLSACVSPPGIDTFGCSAGACAGGFQPSVKPNVSVSYGFTNWPNPPEGDPKPFPSATPPIWQRPWIGSRGGVYPVL